jgi:predicted  nucleic acid-binding Zn-ribbon protein
MEKLKPVLSKYVKLNKEIAELQNEITELRDERRSLDLDLAAVYNEQRDLPSKIELKESKMMFRVKKPNEWKKGWTLSKKDLERYLNEILPEHGPDVMTEIIKRHEPKLVSDDYGFELTSRHLDETDGQE